MLKVISEGLTIEVTVTSSDREMLTIRLHGNHVASINYHTQTDRTDTRKSGFWVQFIEISALTAEQIAEIKAIALLQVTKHLETILGGQK